MRHYVRRTAPGLPAKVARTEYRADVSSVRGAGHGAIALGVYFCTHAERGSFYQRIFCRGR
jgi:hypothetical protein